MEIQELILTHYGKFDNHRIALKPGVNIIYGGNEAGKSTIHSFIRAMFFGLNRGRGKAARQDEYQVRQPWDTPGAYLGSMRVSERGEVYRITRCFDRSTKPLQVICETKHQEMKDPQKAIDWLLGGISESAFINTVYIRQAQCETDEALAQELQNFMINSNQSMDAQLDVAQALQSLRKKKKDLEQIRKREQEQSGGQKSRLQAQLDLVRRELEQMEFQASRRKNQKISDTTMEEYLEEKEDNHGVGAGKLILEFMLLLAGILSIAGAILLGEWRLRVFLGIFSMIFLLMILPVHLFLSVEEDSNEDIDEQDVYFQEAIRRKQQESKQIQEELEQLYGDSSSDRSLETEMAALDMAIDRICKISSGIYSQSGIQLNHRASRILRELTDGVYCQICLTETGEVQVHTPDRVLRLHQVSGGTMQQIYFALRMAAGEMLCGNRKLPVILDETFAMYDDERLEATIRWLKKSGRQVLLFSCQMREREILHRINRR